MSGAARPKGTNYNQTGNFKGDMARPTD